jgi:hypothetical protein
MLDDRVDVEDIENRVGILEASVAFHSVESSDRMSLLSYLAQTSGKHDYLIDLAHLQQEVVHAGSFDNVDVMSLRFNLDRHDVVRGGYHLQKQESGQVRTIQKPVTTFLDLL